MILQLFFTPYLLPFTLPSYVERHNYTNNSAGSCNTRSVDKLGMFFKNLILRHLNLSHAILINLFFCVILKHLSNILFGYKLETLGSDDGVCLDDGRELGDTGGRSPSYGSKIDLKI